MRVRGSDRFWEPKMKTDSKVGARRERDTDEPGNAYHFRRRAGKSTSATHLKDRAGPSEM